MTQPPPVIDVAGSVEGGAARYLAALDHYLEANPAVEVHMIGRGRRLDPAWLTQRELSSLKAPGSRRIAVNNLCFVTGRTRTVLLRNALHFLSPTEEQSLGSLVRPRIRQTGKLVRVLARRADDIIVPSAHMANRVISRIPRLEARCRVLHHPLQLPDARPRPETSGEHENRPFRLVCPILNDDFKQLGPRLSTLAEAIEDTPDFEVRMTLTPEECQQLGVPLSPGVHALGRLTSAAAAAELREADALVVPTMIESFGYPLAEARLLRLPVLAADSELAREIGAECLVPTDFSNRATLRSGLRELREHKVEPALSNPFDPQRYFDTLLRQSD